MSLAWFLLPLLIFSWIFKKPQIDMSVVLGSDLPIFGAFLLWGFLVITFVNNSMFKKYYSTYLGLTFLLTLVGVFSGLPMLAKTCLLLIALFSVVVPAVSTSSQGKRSLFYGNKIRNINSSCYFLCNIFQYPIYKYQLYCK